MPGSGLLLGGFQHARMLTRLAAHPPTEMGFRSVGEMVGRADMLEVDQEVRPRPCGLLASSAACLAGIKLLVC